MTPSSDLWGFGGVLLLRYFSPKRRHEGEDPGERRLARRDTTPTGQVGGESESTSGCVQLPPGLAESYKRL